MIRTNNRRSAGASSTITTSQPTSILGHHAPLALTEGPSLEETVRARHANGYSQRAIARELNIDRRKVKRVIDQAA
jgi:DNA-binding MarR family transcriptional regulator